MHTATLLEQACECLTLACALELRAALERAALLASQQNARSLVEQVQLPVATTVLQYDGVIVLQLLACLGCLGSMLTSLFLLRTVLLKVLASRCRRESRYQRFAPSAKCYSFGLRARIRPQTWPLASSSRCIHTFTDFPISLPYLCIPFTLLSIRTDVTCCRI